MDARGVGEHSTWEESLRTLTLTRPHDDWLKRARQFQAWSEELWQLLTSRLYAATEDPLPPVRALIHGDFGHANLLVANGKLNAVLDWGNSRFGDPLCDCVWIDCWNGGERNVSASYCRRHLISRADAEIRLRPIELSITRNMLTSFAATSQVSKYGYANNLAHYYLRLHS
jgi:aminoglycoside phosphotransferase (APT) family kinase protein